MVVWERHLALCLISGERVCLKSEARGRRVLQAHSAQSEDRKWEDSVAISYTHSEKKVWKRRIVQRKTVTPEPALSFNPTRTSCTLVLSVLISLSLACLSGQVGCLKPRRDNNIHLGHNKRVVFQPNLPNLTNTPKKTSQARLLFCYRSNWRCCDLTQSE